MLVTVIGEWLDVHPYQALRLTRSLSHSGIATYSYHKYQKSVHGDDDAHGPAGSPPHGGNDGFEPLVGAEEGDVSREDREMYVLGDEDEEDEDRDTGRASTSHGKGKSRTSDDVDETLLRRKD